MSNFKRKLMIQICCKNLCLRRVREAGEVRAQTEARIQVMSLAYSSVYGNKVSHYSSITLWKLSSIYGNHPTVLALAEWSKPFSPGSKAVEKSCQKRSPHLSKLRLQEPKQMQGQLEQL